MGFLDNIPYFDGDKPLIIPHRGGANLVPENTLHGLELVIREGFSHFETDLRMSKDGEIFLHHDETFDRTTNVSGKVQDFNWSEISKINAGYKFYLKNNQKGRTTKFVRLTDALLMNQKLKFNLDLKQTGMAKKVVEIINSLNAKERVLVSSFSPKRLDEFLNESIFVASKALSGIEFRANNIESLDNLEKNSVDFYASVKSLYLQDRENKIENQTCLLYTSPSPRDRG